jgi:hypothetical protein
MFRFKITRFRTTWPNLMAAGDGASLTGTMPQTPLSGLQQSKTLRLQPGGKSPRTYLCLDCDRPDPLKSEQASGWLKGEFAPPK